MARLGAHGLRLRLSAHGTMGAQGTIGLGLGPHQGSDLFRVRGLELKHAHIGPSRTKNVHTSVQISVCVSYPEETIYRSLSGS